MSNTNKFVVKNGLLTQNISFVDAIGNESNTINVEMLDSDILSFYGNSGQLFSISDDMTGTIFSVNDISGIPSIEVNADGTISLAETFGNVGIGNSSPSYKLDVAGTSYFGDDVKIGEYDLWIGEGVTDSTIYFGTSTNYFKRGDWHCTRTNMGIYNDWASGYITFNTDTYGEIMRITDDKNVIIGNTTASGQMNTALSVYGGSGLGIANGVASFRRDDAPSNSNTIGYIASFQRINSDTAAWYMGSDTSNRAILAGNNSDIRIGRDSSGTFTEYMRVQNSTGNVGIGTTSPNAKLEVDAAIDDFALYLHSEDNNVYMQMSDDDTTSYITTRNGTMSFGAGQVDLSDNLNIVLSSGNVGIGTTDPSGYKLYVNGNTNINGDLTVNGTISLVAPNAPTSLNLTEIDDYIEITFDRSTSTDEDSYEIWRCESAQDPSLESYSLIAIINQDNIDSIMTILDNGYLYIDSPVYYKIYTVRRGYRSTALEGNITPSNDVAEVTNMTVDVMNEAYSIIYDLPDDRRLANIQIKMHAHADSGSLSEGSASLVYEGLDSNYLYIIQESDLTKYHQFWIYTITRT